jgi:hypothetical protein
VTSPIRSATASPSKVTSPIRSALKQGAPGEASKA